ncbi:unnamed protein product [Lactuca virosa]|uniref:Uncharacterized protein n=1 Tax=Lactuca virosa TaxID=75947 RepID=A0AAU9MXN5_9ASTR|nr:unnamed protein product [Lactuca virosa]
MASTSKKRKEKAPDKSYIQDEESDDDMLNLILLDFELETFKPTSNESNDLFLNLLCDDNYNGWGMGDEGTDDHNDANEQCHFEDKKGV